MKKLFTNAQMRAADKKTTESGVDGETLMRRAGIAIAEETERIASGMTNPEILVVCGTGNNGGDGYVCARKLAGRGFNDAVYAVDGRLSPDCRREKDRYKGAYVNAVSGDIIVDCLFGTGLDRAPDNSAAMLINSVISSGAFVISADIPSGLSGDNGMALGCAVKADVTVAVAQLKLGFYLNDGLDLCGKIVCKEIGIDSKDYAACLAEDADVEQCFPVRRRNSHKGMYGSCGIYAGQAFIGAACLAVKGAAVSGCGYIKLTCDGEVKNALAAAYPQVIYRNGVDLDCDAIAFGMGSGVNERSYEMLGYLLTRYSGKLIIDADGINCLAKYGADVLKGASCKVLLTPHIKEFSRLSGLSVDEIVQNPVGAASDCAAKYGTDIILKGASATVTDGTRATVCARGNSALARGGSGDMLAGFICGCAARGLSLYDAAVCAHELIGTAAEKASERLTEYCVTPDDIIKSIPDAIRSIIV